MADVTKEEVCWLWKPYIPLGKITILEGDPGLGKTWLALTLASIVSTGAPFPSTDGTPGERREPADVPYLTAEDGLGDTLKPRLESAGADCTRVHVLLGKRDPKSDEVIPPGATGYWGRIRATNRRLGRSRRKTDLFASPSGGGKITGIPHPCTQFAMRCLP